MIEMATVKELAERASAQELSGDDGICAILVDARCLQDERFRERGIGQHVAVLLADVQRFMPAGKIARMVAGVDRSLPPLLEKYRALFAGEIALVAAPEPDILFQLSPMTHSPYLLRDALASPRTRSFAIVYDFIPLDYPDRYLSTPDARESYFECLSVLGDYEAFVSISEDTSRRLQQVLGVMSEQCHVSGVAVRESVVNNRGASQSGERYFLVVAGGDDRKNVELPVIAHARSARLQEERVELRVIGHYTEVARDRIRSLHAREGGEADLLHFLQGVDDADLAQLYQNALVTICPSKAEGFSIPVIEANANSCPVIISTCAAQVELMPIADYGFDPEDHERAGSLMEAFLDPEFGRRAMERQGRFWLRFEGSKVQQRCWEPILKAFFQRENCEAPFLSRGRKPLIAVASPVPPDRSGVADYTAATMTALARHADIDLYTPTKGRPFNRAFRQVMPISSQPYRSKDYDSILSVIGNSHLHDDIFRLLLDYGGSSIAHDARMLHFYVSVLGVDWAKSIASREMKEEISGDIINNWIVNQRSMPILFLSEVLEASSKTFVHSPLTKIIIDELYNERTFHLPFAIYREVLPEFVGDGAKRRAREHLGVSDDNAKLLISLGEVTEDKALAECIWVTSLLNDWGVDLRLMVAGGGPPHLLGYLRSLADSLGLQEKVHFTDGPVDERTYQAYLVAADAAIQFRTYRFGGLSGALLDEIAFGVPTVANDHLARAMEAPSYVATVPDGLPPILAAERLLEIFDGVDRGRLNEERRHFVHGHSVDAYAQQLMQGLELG